MQQQVKILLNKDDLMNLLIIIELNIAAVVLVHNQQDMSKNLYKIY